VKTSYFFHNVSEWLLFNAKWANFQIASSLKQQFTGRYVAPLRTHYPKTSLCSNSLMLHALQRISKHQFYCLWFNPDQGSNPQYTTIKVRTLTILSSMKIFDNVLTTTNEDKPLTWSVSSSLKLPAHLHMHASLSLYHSPDNIHSSL
jgi:hypothetical protein